MISEREGGGSSSAERNFDTVWSAESAVVLELLDKGNGREVR